MFGDYTKLIINESNYLKHQHKNCKPFPHHPMNKTLQANKATIKQAKHKNKQTKTIINS
jgi:hypothetical protein